MGVLNGKVAASGIVVICSVDKIAITIQRIDFSAKISKILGQKSTFLLPGANWSLTGQCVQHEKGASLVP